MNNTPLEPGLADYIWNHHRSLMTEAESKAWRHLFGDFKMGGDPSEGRVALMKERFFTDDPEALQLVALGLPEFQMRFVGRVLQEHRSSLTINRCPRCNGVCRTPEAKQCRFCHYDWH